MKAYFEIARREEDALPANSLHCALFSNAVLFSDTAAILHRLCEVIMIEQRSGQLESCFQLSADLI